MSDFTMPLGGAVTQSILPWSWTFGGNNNQYGLFNIYLGQSSNPQVEREALDVASYGKQARPHRGCAARADRQGVSRSLAGGRAEGCHRRSQIHAARDRHREEAPQDGVTARIVILPPRHSISTRAPRISWRAPIAVRAGEAARREMRHINLVERVPFRHVGEIDRAFDQPVEARSRLLQHGADIRHQLAALRFDAARHQRHLARHVADATRQIEHLRRRGPPG